MKKSLIVSLLLVMNTGFASEINQTEKNINLDIESAVRPLDKLVEEIYLKRFDSTLGSKDALGLSGSLYSNKVDGEVLGWANYNIVRGVDEAKTYYVSLSIAKAYDSTAGAGTTRSVEYGVFEEDKTNTNFDVQTITLVKLNWDSIFQTPLARTDVVFAGHLGYSLNSYKFKEEQVFGKKLDNDGVDLDLYLGGQFRVTEDITVSAGVGLDSNNGAFSIPKIVTGDSGDEWMFNVSYYSKIGVDAKLKRIIRPANGDAGIRVEYRIDNRSQNFTEYDRNEEVQTVDYSDDNIESDGTLFATFYINGNL
ncbi:MAG: hypothetical protein HON90_08495 [Halobacteriovoraceae bacterium]|jgi:hypothetical protein|nr:hypothetical protein [Halobacteriovoraceae bacterium]